LVECEKCSRTNHKSSDCRQNDCQCHRCDEFGHIRADCQAKLPNGQSQSHWQCSPGQRDCDTVNNTGDPGQRGNGAVNITNTGGSPEAHLAAEENWWSARVVSFCINVFCMF